MWWYSSFLQNGYTYSIGPALDQHPMSFTVPSHHHATTATNGTYLPHTGEPRYSLVQNPSEQMFNPNNQKLSAEINSGQRHLTSVHMAHGGGYENPVDLSSSKHLSASRHVKEEVGQGHSSAHSSHHHGYLQPGHSMATPVSVGIPENAHGKVIVMLNTKKNNHPKSTETDRIKKKKPYRVETLKRVQQCIITFYWR